MAVQLSVLGLYLPPVFKSLMPLDLRPRRSFHCRSRLPCDVLGHRARWWCWWLSNYPCWDCISRRCSNSCRCSNPPQTIISACRSRLPCDGLGHEARWWCLVASPSYSCWDCISHRCSIGRGHWHSAPDDHFSAGPDCRVIESRPSGALVVSGSCPTIRDWDCISRRCSDRPP